MDESKLPRFVSIRTDLLKGLLRSSPVTGESMRVAIAYFVAAGNLDMMEDLTSMPKKILEDCLFFLRKRGYLE